MNTYLILAIIYAIRILQSDLQVNSISNNVAIKHQCQILNEKHPKVYLQIETSVNDSSGNLVIGLTNNSSCEIKLFSSQGKQVVRQDKEVKIVEGDIIVNNAMLLGVFYKISSTKKNAQYRYAKDYHSYYVCTLKPGLTVRTLIPKNEISKRRKIAIPYSERMGSSIDPYNNANLQHVYLPKEPT